MYEGADRVRGRWGAGGGRWGFGRKEKRGGGEGENLEGKGRREKDEMLRVLRGEDGNKGVGVGEGVEAYPLSTPLMYVKVFRLYVLLCAC